ncbi:MAG: hypothetical protein K9G41_04135 [Flavobacteriales bacterium]|nr:hypothetical protein [Flavobacteriales bacterium]
MKNKVLLVGIVCSLLSGCYREDADLPFIGYEYFPTEIGRFIEYKVDSVWQDDEAGQLGFAEAHYFLRDLSESPFTDEEGRPATRVERYSRLSPFSDWKIKDVWYRVRTEKIAEQNEENIVFVKHNFPLKDGKKWDGNSKNTLLSLQELYLQNTVPEVWEYEYQNVNEPYAINGLTFDSTVTVVQLNRPALVGLDIFAQEVYAKNVGLIHKQLRMYNIQGADTVGFVYEMVITDFGE